MGNNKKSTRFITQRGIGKTYISYDYECDCKSCEIEMRKLVKKANRVLEKQKNRNKLQVDLKGIYNSNLLDSNENPPIEKYFDY